MSSNQVKWYTLLCILIVAGYSWVGYYFYNSGNNAQFTVCPIKLTTGYPCPSCGSTRSVLKIIEGSFTEAILINPLGLAIAFILILLPIWLIYDFVFKSNSMLNTYHKMEHLLQKKKIAYPLIAIVLANWVWNITKGL